MPILDRTRSLSAQSPSITTSERLLALDYGHGETGKLSRQGVATTPIGLPVSVSVSYFMPSFGLVQHPQSPKYLRLESAGMWRRTMNDYHRVGGCTVS